MKQLSSLYLTLVITILLVSCEKEEKSEPNFFTIEIASQPINGGEVNVYNSNDNTSLTSLTDIAKGSNLQFVATSSAGYEFKYWLGDLNGKDSVVDVSLTSDLNITAVFDSIVDSPVRRNGVIKTDKSKIVNEAGDPIQLKGMSLFWSQWIGKYYNKQAIDWLVQDWNIEIIRASMGVDDNGGYIENKDELQKIETVIDAAISNGIYVIVDWHSHHAEDYQSEAIEFFSHISRTYGDNANIIYEIYNEPLQVSWKDVLKPYSEAVIAAIRNNDPDNLIIAGTPNWSQHVDDVIGHEIDDINVAYTFHFYASEEAHYLYLRDKVETALKNDIPIFVTEWGVSEASGTGNFNREWTNEWVDFLNNNNLSWCNWSIADKDETSAALMPNANENGSWTTNEISESGKFIRELLKQ